MDFKKESFRDIEEELKPLIVKHWQEVVSNKAVAVLKPDWVRFRFLEDAGILHCLTARENGELVGYVLHLVVPSLHYSNLLQAHDDAHYLKPEHRKGWAAIKMLKAAEEMLLPLGVGAISYHSKSREDINRGPVFKRLGYQPHEMIYTKYISKG